MDHSLDLLSLVTRALGEGVTVIGEPRRVVVRPSATTFEVVTSGGTVLIRTGVHHTADVHLHDESEAAILATASAHGLAPKVLFLDPLQKVLVMEPAPGNLWTVKDARTPQNIMRIASALRRLHAIEVPTQAIKLDFHAVLLSYWNTLMEQGRGAQAGSAKTRNRIKQLAEDFSRSGPRTLCQISVYNTNIIDSAERDSRVARNEDGTRDERAEAGLMFLDWEYSGVLDPIFDLAGLALHHQYSSELRATLLREYYGSDARLMRRRLDNACVLFTYIRELWFSAREM